MFTIFAKPAKKNVIPSPDEGKLRSQSVSRAKQADLVDRENSSSPDLKDSDDDAIADITTDHRPEPTNRLPATDNSPAQPRISAADNNPVTDKTPNPKRGVCPFYRRGTCRHGMSGKGCKKEHLKPCPKLIRHGNRGPRGCSAGTNCDKFHPKMCPLSLSAGEYLTTDCKLRHIIGPRRKLQGKQNVIEIK